MKYLLWTPDSEDASRKPDLVLSGKEATFSFQILLQQDQVLSQTEQNSLLMFLGRIDNENRKWR
jgi:hypothetical protein